MGEWMEEEERENGNPGEGNRQHIHPKPQHCDYYFPSPCVFSCDDARYENDLVPMTRSPLWSRPVVANDTFAGCGGSRRRLVNALTILHCVSCVIRFATPTRCYL